ncbi:MAG TPA: hypothetical protein VIJ47_02415, partial [Acidimicrobiales bacterium]
WRRAPAALLAVAALAVAVVPAVSVAGAVDGQPWSITASPTSFVTDGQPLVMNVKTSDPAFPIYFAEAHVCRTGITYRPSSGDRPNDDFRLGGDNCPLTPISSSADAGVTASTYLLAPTPGGATFSMAAGVGVVDWVGYPSGVAQTLTCDSTHPCTLVVELQAGNPATWIPWQIQLNYQIDDPVAGCGGPASSVVSSAASDRISDAWVNWTLAACKLPGQKGALTTASFLSEGDAVQGFSTGRVDMAYSAVGYDPAVDLAPDNPKPTRPAIYVPVAVNATVFAVGNGQPGPGGHKIPYTTPQLSLDDTASMVAGGAFSLTPELEASIRAKNPQFDPTKGGTAIYTSVNGVYPVEGPAESESSSWIGTNFLSQLAPTAFVAPNIPAFGTDAGKPRGADAALALAKPSYSLALGLYSGRPSLRKVLRSFGGYEYGGLWALTDLETATVLGMVPSAIQNTSGQFVAPTAETLTAAVPSLVPQADGTLLPNPRATAPAGQTQPYAQTFVEYAMVPAEPLVDASGCARPGSQKLLKDWLAYVLGDGQKNLPPGMLPLTTELTSVANQQLAKVGATASTATCTAPPPSIPATDASSGSADVSGNGSSGSSEASFTSSSGSSSTGSPAAVTPPPGSPVAGAALAAASTPIPDYNGHSPASGLVAVATLLGIVVLVFGAAALSSGRGRSLLRLGDRPGR